MKTGGVKNIGSVFLSIYGTKAELDKIVLKENKLKKAGFDKDALDEFDISGVDVGEVCWI